MRALASLRPAPPGGPSLSAPGALEAAVENAGLLVRESGTGRLAFAWPDRETMLAGMTFSGGVVRISRSVGDEAVRAAVSKAMKPFRTPAGGYRLENDWTYVLASA